MRLSLVSILIASACTPPPPQTPYMFDLREQSGCEPHCAALGFWSEHTAIDPNGDPEEQPEQSLYRFFYTGSSISVYVENARDRPAAPVDESVYICLARWSEGPVEPNVPLAPGARPDEVLQCEWSSGEWIDMAYFDRRRNQFYVRAHSGRRFYFEHESTLPLLGLPHSMLLRIYLQVGPPAEGEGHIYLPRGTAPRPQ